MNELTETLRYFYSAVFQGFAAIMSMGFIVYIYRRESLERQMTQLEIQIKDDLKTKKLSDRYLMGESFESFCYRVDNNILNLQDDCKKFDIYISEADYINLRKSINRFNILFRISNQLTSGMKNPVLFSIYILLYSITSLLFLDYLGSYLGAFFLLVIIFIALVEIVFYMKKCLDFEIHQLRGRSKFVTKLYNLVNWESIDVL